MKAWKKRAIALITTVANGPLILQKEESRQDERMNRNRNRDVPYRDDKDNCTQQRNPWEV